MTASRDPRPEDDLRLPDEQVSGGRLTGAPRPDPGRAEAEPPAAGPGPLRPVACGGTAGEVWVGRAPVARPRAVLAACWLGVLDALIAFAILGVQLATTDDLIVQAMGEADSFLPRDGDISTVYYGVTTGMVVLHLMLAAVWGALLLLLLRGRGWARAALTMIVFVWAVSTLLSLVGTRWHGELHTALEVAQVVALVATAVCVHLGSTRDHFSGTP
ncbi:hypothetical protein ACL03H_19565 [Saccharopolyspora sp. MS10]|uniref:hypothetical protein n=1 Tax=Saccharopolyspora sp. MS10 TaxID=3385973 RepID=UPI0039A176B6